MLPKITRGTLADQVTQRLLEYIEAQHLKAGDLIPSETSLAKSFGVSRPVVREALKNLEGKGVIEIINGKGALVRPIDSDPLRLFFLRAMQMERGSMLELMEVRKGMEIQAAVLAAARRDEKDLEAIHRVVDTMRSSMNDVDSFTRLDVEFHLLIAEASHNRLLYYLIESIRDALRNTIITGLKSRGASLDFGAIQHTHELLLQTLEDGDVEAARQAMVQHFDEAIAALANPQAEQPS